MPSTQVQTKPVHMPWITPYLTVTDVEKAAQFYQDAFDFTFNQDASFQDDSGHTVHAEVSHNNGVVMLGKEKSSGITTQSPKTSGTQSPVCLYVYCDDVDSLFDRALGAGAKVKEKPSDQFWGDRMCSLFDPDGHCWNFATKINV